jgi:thioredoxin reductase
VYRLLEPEHYRGKKVLVVGGGDSAIEAAMSVGEAGASVHLAHRREAFDRIKKKNQDRLDAAVAEGRVQLLMNAAPTEIRVASVSLKVKDAEQEIANDFVIVCAGGVLPTTFLEKAGVKVQSFKGEAFAPANA